MRPPQKTGENQLLPLATAAAREGFNEAPAEDGGKLGRRAVDVAVLVASMRPPQKTGENILRFKAAVCPAGASMRPPQKTGENHYWSTTYGQQRKLQ